MYSCCSPCYSKWNGHKDTVDANNFLISYSVVSQSRSQCVEFLYTEGNPNSIPERSESSLVLHISTYCCFPLTSTFGPGSSARFPKNILGSRQSSLSPLCSPNSLIIRISPSSGVISLFAWWFSGIRSPECQAAVSSSNSVETLLHPLVEVSLFWVPRPSNQENSKLCGQETKFLYATIAVI